MKKFVTPALEELKITETANGWDVPWPEGTIDIIPGNNIVISYPGASTTSNDQGGDQTTGDGTENLS